MSATSGITASQDLLDQYATAVSRGSGVRFLKIAIQNESLVPLGTWPCEGPELKDDLHVLATILEDNIPAYILAKLDSGDNDWLFISYVPDVAKVRDKMLYASSRNALTKAIGGQVFKDTIFATSKSDVTPDAYAAHLRHLAAPKPMSAREAELAEIRQAELKSVEMFEGSRARKSHVDSQFGLKWTQEVQDVVDNLTSEGSPNLIIIGVNTDNESLQLVNATTVELDDLADALPSSDPCYAFYRWQGGKIVSIYTCPSASKIKVRMIYSSGKQMLINQVELSVGQKVFRRLEATEPKDLDLSFVNEQEEQPTSSTGPPSFARPKGPPRRR
ncbi:Twinfilin-1 [Tulasnella sp. 403]|nr:Twinfilin-1 [Tulasnella sp. 403]